MLKNYPYLIFVAHLTFLTCTVDGSALLLMYQPKDITHLCSFSSQVQFDLTFGMGLSDTLTVVMRTLNVNDYWCDLEIISNIPNTNLIVVVRYPSLMIRNCLLNPDALVVVKNNQCTRLCDIIEFDAVSVYFIFTLPESFTLRFTSNSSINKFLNANFYQVTVTSARHKPKAGCHKRNETLCAVAGMEYCFTSGVVCDGIRNCGIEDWYDERTEDCITDSDTIGLASVLTLLGLLICVGIAAGHLLVKSLPPIASSFFIFNANEDNRLCIDAKLIPSGVPPEIAVPKRASIIPVSSSSSEDIPTTSTHLPGTKLGEQISRAYIHGEKQSTQMNRKSKIKSMADKLKFVAGYGRRSNKEKEMYVV